MENLLITGASIAGTDHTKPLVWKNNQDGMAWKRSTDCLVAIVTDGCGSCVHSEVGAKLGAASLAAKILQAVTLYHSRTDHDIWEALEYAGRVLEKYLEEWLTVFTFGQSKTEKLRFVNDHFLFTLVGAIITPGRTIIFHLGDGLAAVNGEIMTIGPYPDNMPPYLGYELAHYLTGRYPTGHRPRFELLYSLATADLRSLMIGTDGVRALIDCSGRNYPGTDQRIDPLSRFWQEDKYFANPDMVRRELARLNRPVTRLENNRIIKENGLLPDDTTLIVIKQKDPDQTGPE